MGQCCGCESPSRSSLVGLVSLMLLVGYSPCSELMAAIVRLDALNAGACADKVMAVVVRPIRHSSALAWPVVCSSTSSSSSMRAPVPSSVVGSGKRDSVSAFW